MSCMVMNHESMAALAYFTEALLNMGYDYFGFKAPDELFQETRDCWTYENSHYCSTEKLYNKMYALNIAAYDGRYRIQTDENETAPEVDFTKCRVHDRAKYDGHHIIEPWHYKIAKLLDFWLYQTCEDATVNDPFRLAMEKLKNRYYEFIVENSNEYAACKWGAL